MTGVDNMVVFWGAAALMLMLAAGFVLWPLWTRGGAAGVERQALVFDLFNEHKRNLDEQRERGELDADQYQQLLQELQLSLLEDVPPATDSRKPLSAARRRGLLALALLLPLAALMLYDQRGNLEDLRIGQLRAEYFQQQGGGSGASGQALLEELVERLQRRLEARPDNLGNRYLLARVHMQRGEFGAAIEQYTHILQDGEPPAYIIGELAQAIFLAAGNRVTPEVTMLVERALALDANESTSLGLAGIGAFEQQDYTAAIDYWQRAVAQLGPASPGGQALQAGIERARQLIGAGVGPELTVPSDDAAGPAITVQVALAPGVQAAPNDTVFVYARAWQGARMPLAITRLTVAQLPASVTLDESMAMAPGMTLSSVPEVELVARISPSANPLPTAGDWQGSLGPLVPTQVRAPVELLIAEQLP